MDFVLHFDHIGPPILEYVQAKIIEKEKIYRKLQRFLERNLMIQRQRFRTENISVLSIKNPLV